MKNNKVLAIALLAGLIISGGLVNKSLAAEAQPNQPIANDDATWNGYDDEYTHGWNEAAEDFNKKLVELKDYRNEFVPVIKSFSKLTSEEKSDFVNRANASYDTGEIYKIYNEAADLNNSRDKLPEREKPQPKKRNPDTTEETPVEDIIIEPTPILPVEKEVVVENKEVDGLIKTIEDNDKKIREEMSRLDKELNKDDKKPEDENKKPETDEDNKDNAPSKEKVIIKEIIKEPDTKKTTKSTDNPKTGVGSLSAVATTAAISMAGIVATRKK